MLAGKLAYALGAALVAVSLLLGLQTFRLAGEQRDHANTRTAHAEKVQEFAESARKATEDAAAESLRRAEAIQGVTEYANKQIDQARSDADAARAAGDGLRKRFATLAATCGATASDSKAASSGEAAGSAGAVLTNVLERLDDAAGILAQYADESRAAGLACERSYMALNPK